jgi:phosphopantetheine adenylyltransferase
VSDSEQQAKPNEQPPMSEAELQEIAGLIAEICKKSGYGILVITVRGGEIFEMELNYKLRPKTEKKKTQI